MDLQYFPSIHKSKSSISFFFVICCHNRLSNEFNVVSYGLVLNFTDFAVRVHIGQHEY